MTSNVYAKAAACFLSLLLMVTAAVGQTTTGTIQGTVRDSAGAIIPNATVTVTNVNTNVSSTWTTNDNGDFTAPFQIPGDYEVAVEMANYKRTVRGGIKLLIGERAVADIALEAGQISETVSVISDTPLIKTATSEVSQVIEGRPINELPLNSATGRNFTGLMTLIPGTLRTNPVGLFDAPQGNSSFSVNGQRDSANNYTVDGADNNESLLGIVTVLPPPDAIGEFKIQTNAYAAEFGRAGGAVVNVQTRSGTNNFSGSLYTFLRNDAFDARGPFDAAKLPPLRQNEIGGTIGGPIKRDSTFFFFDYVYFRQRAGQTYLATVPTLAQRQGNFLASEGAGTIFNPYTARLVNNVLVRDPFPGNVIPQSLINPIGQRLINLYPAPNRTGNVRPGIGVGNNFSGVSTQVQDAHRFDLRIDHTLTQNDNLTGRYSFFDAYTALTPLFGNQAIGAVPARVGQGDSRNQNLVLSEVHTFSPSKINEFRVSYNRIATTFAGYDYGTNLAQELGIPNINIFGETSSGLPRINFSDELTAIGTDAPIPAIRYEETYQLVDNFSLISGRHNVKFGADIRRFRGDFFQISLESPRGRFDFDRNYTGSSAASLLLGFPSLIRRGVIYDTPRNRLAQYFFFAQDDFKVSSRLTLNYGLRYELYTPALDQRDNQSNFDIRTGQVLIANRGNNSRSLVETDGNNFAPRVGFAFSLNDRTVTRGGYGVSYFPDKFGASGGTLNTNYPYITLQEITPADRFIPTPSLSISNGIPVPLRPSLTQESVPLVGDITVIDPQYEIGYTQFWNLMVQRQFMSDLLLEVAYVGTKGTNLFGNVHVNLNQPAPGPGAIAARRPYATLAPAATNIRLRDSSQSSIYHSLQVKFEKRLSRGFYFLNSYTWSKSIDDNALKIDPTNWRDRTRGPSGTDARHLFTHSSLFELPIGRGRRFGGDMNPVLDAVIGGWQLNGIYTFRTGLPTTATLSAGLVSLTLNNGGANRPDQIADPNDVSNRSINQWFNTAAFVAPATNSYRFGNAGRNTIRGPRLSNLDISLFKNFRFRERYTVQFRSEFFNIPNHPNYALPNATLGAPTYGVISSLVGNMRQVQFGLKLLF